MRVSTLGSFQRGLGLMQSLQAQTNRTQLQISTGKRLLVPSDDPIAASRVLELRESLSRLEQFDRNSNIATNRLQNEEVALQSANDVLQRVRELALQANNASQSNETRGLIAIEMRERLDQLVQIANQQDGSGQFLFSGNLDETTPVSSFGGTFVYNGDQGQRQIQIGEGRTVPDGDSGADVFFMIREGNGTFAVSAAAGNTGSGVAAASSVTDPTQYDGAPYTVQFIDATNYEVLDSASVVISTGTYLPGDSIGFRGIEFTLDGAPAAGDGFGVNPSAYQDVFTSVQNLIVAVEISVDDDVSRASLNNGINAGLLNIDQAIGNILDVRTRVGSRLAAVESQTDANSSFELNVQATIGELEDLDYAEALSRLSLELTVLEAAQQSFIRTQSLSLFDFF